MPHTLTHSSGVQKLSEHEGSHGHQEMGPTKLGAPRHMSSLGGPSLGLQLRGTGVPKPTPQLGLKEPVLFQTFPGGTRDRFGLGNGSRGLQLQMV